jgi:hypothetical protein
MAWETPALACPAVPLPSLPPLASSLDVAMGAATVVFARRSRVRLLCHATSTVKMTAVAPAAVTFSSRRSDAARSRLR